MKLAHKLFEIARSTNLISIEDFEFFCKHIRKGRKYNACLYYEILYSGTNFILADIVIERNLFDINEESNYCFLISEAIFENDEQMIDFFIQGGLNLNKEKYDIVMGFYLKRQVEECFASEDGLEAFYLKNEVVIKMQGLLKIELREEKILKIKRKF